MKIRIALLSLLITSAVLAINTSHWTHTSEADFKAGTFHNVVATNLGDLKLSRAVKTILGQNEHISAVHALVEAKDGTIYAGTGPEGVLLAIKDEKSETVAKLGENVSIFSLLIDSKGRLLIGTGGEKGQIFRIEKPGDKPVEIFSETGVQYIWAMCQTPDGKIYAATGPEGQLFQIDENDKHEVLFDSEQNNLTSMVSDGKDLLYVGSDPDGLIYRINRKTKDTFVVFDAPETEISALLLDKDGTLFAGTASEIETPAESAQPAGEEGGRPENDTGGVPIPTQPPEAPKPPSPTPPNPGEPAPIPKEQAKDEPKTMMILADEPGDGGDNPTPPSPVKAEQAATNAGSATQSTGAKPEAAAAAPTQGNAIYRVDKDGFVTEIFRQPVIVYSLIEQNGLLLVGTGSDGEVYQVNPTAEETVVLAKVDPKEVISLLPTKDGRIVMGLANSGDVALMTPGFAYEGTFTSPVLDATQISRFGKMQLHGTLPADTKLTVSTRSSNVGEDTDRGWSKWTAEQPATEFMPIASSNARYLQYRLTFTTTTGKDTAVVDDVDVAYQVPNLAPIVKSVKIAPKAETPDTSASPSNPKPPADHHMLTLTWEATDANNDALQYSIYFRNGKSAEWILLKDKLTDATWDWDTRAVADGRYEIKVTASDEAANPRGMGKTASRVSDPVVVDNTAPVVGDLKAVAKGAAAHIELRAVDRTSTIASLEYSVDSSTDWQSVLPSDNIADSPDEAYSFDTQPLSSGAHQITIRASDAYGNQAHESVTINVAAPTAMK
ncbi:MAG TPA: hypothetical protein VHS31_08305 [Tepidisphaeraceae bacterium]|jgi:hypothetical protein|nr:hypothetical protein [Tepidisphaeraceae bacterium]